jgi:hypothetical protein
LLKRFVVDGVIIGTAKAFGDYVEKKYELKLEEQERKRLEAFFNAIPVEIQNLYLQNTGEQQILGLKDGQFDVVLDQITQKIISQNIKNTTINPKTNKPYTESELNEINKIVLETLKKELNK